ncbi:hypothetical protein JCM3770_002507 [Rhodotorula araucariae]
MLTTLELLSSLTGYWAMGTGIWLFCPEVYDLLKYPPREIDRARLTFFACWLGGDITHLIATIIAGHALLTQIILYIIVAVVETGVISYILWCTGKCCVARKRYPEEEISREEHMPLRGASERVAKTSNRPPGHARTVHEMAEDSGYTWEEKVERANASRRARGKKTPWKEKTELPAMTKFLIQTTGTLVVVGLFTIIWWRVVLDKRDTAKPPLPMEFPHTDLQKVGYGLGWAGFVTWIAPRAYCILDAVSKRRREGITTGTIGVGALTHGLNIVSILLVNNTKWPLLAQLPYILTSMICIILDFVRLAIKRHFSKERVLPPDQDHSVLYPAKAYSAKDKQRADEQRADEQRADEQRAAVARRRLRKAPPGPPPRPSLLHLTEGGHQGTDEALKLRLKEIDRLWRKRLQWTTKRLEAERMYADQMEDGDQEGASKTRQLADGYRVQEEQKDKEIKGIQELYRASRSHPTVRTEEELEVDQHVDKLRAELNEDDDLELRGRRQKAALEEAKRRDELNLRMSDIDTLWRRRCKWAEKALKAERQFASRMKRGDIIRAGESSERADRCWGELQDKDERIDKRVADRGRPPGHPLARTQAERGKVEQYVKNLRAKRDDHVLWDLRHQRKGLETPRAQLPREGSERAQRLVPGPEREVPGRGSVHGFVHGVGYEDQLLKRFGESGIRVVPDESSDEDMALEKEASDKRRRNGERSGHGHEQQSLLNRYSNAGTDSGPEESSVPDLSEKRVYEPASRGQ